MAVIYRDEAPPRIDEMEPLAPLDEQETERGAETEWSRPALVLLAVLSAAAGVIHIAMVPSHAGEWMAEAVAFAIVGWFQIGVAVVLLTRPSRPVLTVTALANVAFVAAWAVSRVWGLPFGPESGIAESASFVDIACAVFEGLLVVGAVALILRPGLGSRLSSAVKVPLSVIPLAVVVVATMAITSSSATGHAHGGEEGEVAGAAHSHDAGAPEDDKGLSLIMNGAGEGGGHVHDSSVVELDDATQAQLDAQLAQLQPFIEKYPTVRDAEAAGYRRQGPYSPGLGAHYSAAGAPSVSVGPTMTDEALKHPMLIYEGVTPESKIVGFMYLIFSLDEQNPPEGFAGPNDHWHFHTDVCIVPRADGSIDTPLGADQASTTKETCDLYNGVLVANTGYMVHVWPVPGFDSPQGLFSNLNSRLACPNGTYYTVSQEEVGTRTNVCRDVPN